MSRHGEPGSLCNYGQGAAPRRILILGATSAIAQAVGREAAARGDALFLVGRHAERLAAVADDLRARGAGAVQTLAADLTDRARHRELLSAATAALGGLEVVLVAHGVLTDQAAAQADPDVLRHDFDVNFLSAAELLTLAANQLEAQRRGHLLVLGSVAGDRGRQSNYVYGSAKAALEAFLSGLRNRLHASGVRVTTVKPGFVDTPMTARLPKNALFARPDAVGRAIYRILERPRDVVYVPAFWRMVMLVVRAVPESIFKRLKL
jgi:decaprenylphospho-beta-D-erythro-pentofuranosid-2-ulose 2-reductase